MPQDSIFPSDPRSTGLRLTIRAIPVEGGWADNVTVEVELDNNRWTTVYGQRWSGLMLDLYTTLAEDVVSSYLYETPRDVGRSAVSVAKMARAHARRHDRVASESPH